MLLRHEFIQEVRSSQTLHYAYKHCGVHCVLSWENTLNSFASQHCERIENHCAWKNNLKFAFLSAPTCLAPSPPTSGTSSLVSGSRVPIGARNTFTCDAGFEIVGQSSSTCNSKGLWSASVPTCERKLMLFDWQTNHRNISKSINEHCLCFFSFSNLHFTCKDYKPWCLPTK